MADVELKKTDYARSSSRKTFGAGDIVPLSGPNQIAVNAGSTHVPAWAMDQTTAESILVGGSDTPESCDGFALEIGLVASNNQTGSSGVFRAVSSTPSDAAAVNDRQWQGACVVAQLPNTGCIRYQTVEACFPKDSENNPTYLRLIREAADGFDTWAGDANVATIRVSPVILSDQPVTVAPAEGYNSWPMIISTGSRLHCYYSKGEDHDTPSAAGRSVVARYSDDNNATWSAERVIVAGSAGVDWATCGKGTDSSGNVLLWLRRTAVAGAPTMHLYKASDGMTFSEFAAPTFPIRVIQITDIFTVPTVGLMAFWMAGAQSGEAGRSWGIVTSADDGVTWAQEKKEDSANDLAWPTEISGAYIGSSGQIMAIGRSEVTGTTTAEQSMFQLASSNYGSTFARNRTNISDIHKSTPSVIFDDSGFNVYYFRRTWGSLRRRQLPSAATVFAGGTAARLWPAAQPVAQFQNFTDQDAGNANACVHSGKHYVACYLGDEADCAIMVSRVTP